MAGQADGASDGWMDGVFVGCRRKNRPIETIDSDPDSVSWWKREFPSTRRERLERQREGARLEII